MSQEQHNLEKALNVSYEPKNTEIKKVEPKEIEVPNKLDHDFTQARKSLKNLIDVGEEGIEGILKVAQEGDHPRAYEVLSGLIKTVSDVNKDMLDLHKKVSDIETTEKKLVQNNTTNNSFFVGSTTELQDLINPERSRVKAIENNND